MTKIDYRALVKFLAALGGATLCLFASYQDLVWSANGFQAFVGIQMSWVFSLLTTVMELVMIDYIFNYVEKDQEPVRFYGLLFLVSVAVVYDIITNYMGLATVGTNTSMLGGMDPRWITIVKWAISILIAFIEYLLAELLEATKLNYLLLKKTSA